MNLNTQKNTILVPFYNEASTLEDSVLDLINNDLIDEIILLNDGSTDGSSLISKKLADKYSYIKIINSSPNKGKGYALRLGLEQATFDIVGIFDADLEYSARDLKVICNLMHKDNLDLMCGSRFIGDQHRDNIYLRTFIANKLFSLFFSLIYGRKFTDVATCLKVFKKDLLNGVELRSDGFEIEIELLAKLLSKVQNYKEFPISYKGRSYLEGKKIKFIDGFKYIYSILKFKWTK